MNSEESGKRRGHGIVGLLLRLVVLVAAVIVIVWALRTYVFQTYEVPSGSMEETIMPGDMVFAEKVSYYMHEPETGDIVTFDDPQIASRVLIKRCIAVGGQTVNINDYDGLVYVDGEPLSEPYVEGETYTLNGGVSFPYTVPDGYIWVMGDNRENSQDSRYFGAIPISSVNGHGVLVYWPLDEIGLLQ